MKNKTCVGISIPFSKIKKISIYDNSEKRNTLYNIMRQTKADYAINGTLYNTRTLKPVCPLKINDNVQCKSIYTYTGYIWNEKKPDSFHLGLIPCENSIYNTLGNNPTWNFNNYIACSVLVKDGKEIDKPIYTTAQGGKRGRTVIGTKVVNGEERLCFYVTKDGSRYASKPESIAKLLVKSGWNDAVMLDSGGSSQYYSKPENERVYTTRINGHYILVYLK